MNLNQLSDLREALENSSIGLKVDLVREEDLSEIYRPQVLKDRIPFS